VSNVFGKQLPNIHASSLLPMLAPTCAITCSTAGLLNFRLDSGVRTTGKSESAAHPVWFSAKAEPINAVL
jgi:hypothetical protein